jgi:hypothetical protein
VIPKPRDPRTPLQQTRDRIAAARRQLQGEYLSRSTRQQLSDHIWELIQAEQAILAAQEPTRTA